jgi:hypothetical protein
MRRFEYSDADRTSANRNWLLTIGGDPGARRGDNERSAPRGRALLESPLGSALRA